MAMRIRDELQMQLEIAEEKIAFSHPLDRSVRSRCETRLLTRPMTNTDSASSTTMEAANRALRTMRYQPIQVTETILERASRSIRLRGEGDPAISLSGERKPDPN